MIEWLREQALLWDNIVDPGIEFRAVLAFISYLERTGASPWASVEDGRKPQCDQAIFIHSTTQPFVAWPFWTHHCGDFPLGTTHWMPLPPLP